MKTSDLLGYSLRPGEKPDPKFVGHSPDVISELRAYIDNAYNQIIKTPDWCDVKEVDDHYYLEPDQHQQLIQKMKQSGAPDNFKVTRQNRLLLVNCGFKPQSLMTPFEWKGYTPRRVQVVTSSYFTRHKRSWCTNGLRSGKTLSAGAGAKRLQQLGDIKRILVIAPLSILNESWASMFGLLDPFGDHIVCNKGSKETRKVLKERPDCVILNPDKTRYLMDEIIAYAPDLIILDEANVYKHIESSSGKKTVRTENFMTIVQALNCMLWSLTATPITKLATDLWPVGSLIDKDMPGYYSWRRQTCGKIPGKKSIYYPLPDNVVLPLARKHMTPVIGYPTAACIDLPDQIYVGSEVALTPAQDKALHDLNEGKGAVVDGRFVSGYSQGKKQKMVQILAGAVRVSTKAKDDNDNFAQIDCFDRINLLTEIVKEEREAAGKKVLIFCPFIGGQYVVRDRLEKAGVKSRVYNGRTSPTAREKILADFRGDPEIYALIVHPEVGKHGLDLSICDVSIWFIPPVSTDQWIQGNGRAQSERTEDKTHTTIRYIYSTTWEKEMYQRLAKLQKTAVLATSPGE